jgi:hypothetical protein
VGNLYSRVATPDWSELPARKKQLNAMARGALKGGSTKRAPEWIPDAAVEEASRAKLDLSQIPDAELASKLKTFEPRPPLERAIGSIEREFRDLIPGVDEAVVVKLGNRLRNDEQFRTAFRSAGQFLPEE